jgi:hypothetical protein
MTPTTETVRSQGFLPLESDIPAGLTIEQYRADRRPREPRRRRRPRLHRRRSR